jgi:hypothetical protein
VAKELVLPEPQDTEAAGNLPLWKNFVIGALTVPDLISSATPIPPLQQPNLVQSAGQQVVEQINGPERKDAFRIDQSLKDLADYQDVLDEQRRTHSSDLGYAVRESNKVQQRPATRDER